MGNVKKECGFYNSIIIENVRITPKSLIFYNPLEGQEYKAKIVLQNIGKNAVYVRILNASSSNVIFQPILNTQFLSAGLTITREIKYKVVMATLTRTCSIPIHINASKYLFQISVEQKKTSLRIEPQYLDFGVIDTGPLPARRHITFFNDGLQTVRFHIDLGPNELNIMIDPMKGLISAKSSLEVRVDVFLLKEGTYLSEFWIISGVPTCMQLKVSGRHGHIETLTRFNMNSFKFLHFPITYYGLSSSKIILLKNASQKQSIFCVTGIKQMNIFNVGDAPHIDSDYYQFRVLPKEGHLFENDVRVFTFTFAPQKKYISKNGYYLVMMRINKVQCRDLNPDDYAGEIFETLQRSTSSVSRGTSEIESITAFDEYLDTEDQLEESIFAATTNDQDHYVNVMLYGNAETPNVLITPSELLLRDLEVKVPLKRVLLLKNCSKYLPIILRYKKIAFVEINPPLISINARQSVEVLVTITPQSYYIVKTAIQFDLLHYDQPRKTKLLHKIGEVQIPLTMHERIITVPSKSHEIYAIDYPFPKGTPKPRMNIYQRLLNENVILGLPDDRPTALRPWKSATVCKTIYAELPRVCHMANEFEFTNKQIALQQNAKVYYRKFIRNYALKKQAAIKQPSNEYLHVDEMACVPMNVKIKNPIELECANFIPLTPQQLLNITIKSRNQFIDHIVPKSLLRINIAVENSSSVDLRIFLKPQKPQFCKLPNGARFIVRKFDSIQLTYYIYAHLIGLQNYRLDIIINECHVFETTVTMNIVQEMLLLTPTELNFTSSDPTYKFIEFYNHLNQDISFEWISTDDFTLEPMDGIVQSRNKLACLVGFNQRKVHGHPYGVYELLIKIGGKHITFRIKVAKANIEFLLPDHVNFGTIPVGIPSRRFLSLLNFCKQPVSFQCGHLSWVPEGIDIEPTEGVLRPNIVQWLKLTINLSQELAFECQLHICFGDVKTRSLTIEGIGMFPKILMDEQLQFRKIAASGFDIQKFSLQNNSPVPALVAFDVEKLAELHVSEREDSRYFMKNNVQYIKPFTGTSFCIHYYPSYPEMKYFHLPMSVNGVQNQITKKGKQVDSLVPRLRVYTQTFTHRVVISSWSYSFHYYDDAKYESIKEHTVMMSNTPNTSVRLCLRLDNVREPFELCNVQGGNIIKQHDFAIVVELSCLVPPLTFKVKFCPSEYSKYEMRIPVFIKDDHNEDVHNYIYFIGTYYQPTFTFPDEAIYFGYIPLDFKIVKFVKIKLKYHRPHCLVTVKSDNANVTLTCNPGQNEYSRTIKILYCCRTINVMHCSLKVKCTCGSFSEILMLGGAENTYLTIYNCVEFLRYRYGVDVYVTQHSTHIMDSQKIRSESVSQVNIKTRDDVEYVYKSDFPLFPKGDNLFATYFHRTVEVVEKWVCQQGFHGSKYFTIPSGLCYHETLESKAGNRIILPFCTLFCNICSIKENTFDLSFDLETNIYLTIYKFYTEILELLHNLGGIVTHIRPESLFPYETYVRFLTKHRSSQKVYTPERFHLWSKQAWLHLILQTYKVFVLKRLIKINQPGNKEYNLIRTIKSMHSVYSMLNTPTLNTNDHIQTELSFIIDWANTDYNMTKVVFMHTGFINHNELPPRTIKFFNEEFKDGTILAAITLTYCPYLEEYFYTLYLPPTNSQQYFYNAYLLIKVWNMLNISLHLKPNDITECNPITLIFLLTYLYDFLTHFKPRKEIQFSAELTKTNEVEVQIMNENKLPINYELCIFNDARELFKVNKYKITVPKHQSIKLLVYYTARFVKSNRAVLVLKGEINAGRGSKYTHGQAFVLKGTTLVGPPYIHIQLQSDIYSMYYRDLEFTAPYSEDCEYELYLTYTEPVNLQDLQLVPVKSLIASQTLGRIHIETPYLESKQQQIRKRIRLCSITLNPLKVWIFARHPNVGDFYIKIECNVRSRQNILTLLLEISNEAFRNACLCNGKSLAESKCPRICVLKVPCKNESMWKGLLKYFFKYRGQDEYQFWNYYKDTPVGLHVLKRLLFDQQEYVTADMSYIFEPHFRFDVKNYNTSVTMEKTVKIENTLSVEQYTGVLIHLNEPTSNFMFELHNGKEERCYNVLLESIEGSEES